MRGGRRRYDDVVYKSSAALTTRDFGPTKIHLFRRHQHKSVYTVVLDLLIPNNEVLIQRARMRKLFNVEV